MHHCEGWVGTETGMGTGGDGSQCIREWVERVHHRVGI